MPEAEIWLLELAILILIAKLFEGLAKKTGIPRVVFFVILGVCMAYMKFLFNYTVSSVLEAFATFGIVSLLFLAGLEGSLRYFIRGLKTAGIIAVGGVVGALLCGFLAMAILKLGLNEAIAIGIVFSATSVSVTITTFEELGMLNTREAMLIVEAAVVDDVIGLVLLSFLGAFKEEVEYMTLLSIPVIAFLVWYGTAWFSSKYMDSVLKNIGKLRVFYGVEAFALAILFILAFLAQEIGLSSILLAYAYGIGLASHRYFAKKIGGAVGFISAVFAPLFFIYVGYKLDVEYLHSIDILSILYIVAVIIVLGFASKIIGCYIASRLIGLPHKSSLVVSIGMVPRSEVAMIASTLAYELGLIEADLFAAHLTMILATVLLAPIVLKKILTMV